MGSKKGFTPLEPLPRHNELISPIPPGGETLFQIVVLILKVVILIFILSRFFAFPGPKPSEVFFPRLLITLLF